MCAALIVWQAELDAAVETPRAQERWIERIRTVCRHQHLDVATRVEAVELVDELEHRALDLVVATGAVVKAHASDGVDLVEEDDARLFCPRKLEELANHTRALADVLLHEL